MQVCLVYVGLYQLYVGLCQVYVGLYLDSDDFIRYI